MKEKSKISKDKEEDIYSNPGCLCAPFICFFEVVGFIVMLLKKEIKAEKEDAINQAEDCYSPTDKTNFNKTIHTSKRERF